MLKSARASTRLKTNTRSRLISNCILPIKAAIGGGLALPGKPPLEITPLKPKQCVRGWMNFAVTPGQVPVSIHYRELSAEKKPIDWMIK